MAAQFVDLSHPLSSETPVYPGDHGVDVRTVSVAAEPGPNQQRQLNNSRLSFGVHNGTHIDSPFHFFSNRETIHQVALNRCCGRAVRLKLETTEVDGVICARDLRKLEATRQRCRKVLIYTGWDRHWGSPDYFSGHPVLTKDAAELLVEWKVDLVGVDFPSVDRPPFDAHVALLGNDVLIVENLTRLEQIGTYCDFCAMPLPLAGRDASPVRAFAKLEAQAKAVDVRQEDVAKLVDHQVLRDAARHIFRGAGSDAHEAERIAHYLIEANLVGHDSHGVIRVPIYVNYIQKGKVVPNQHATVVADNGPMLVIDGGGGFGQVVAEEAMTWAIERSGDQGVCVLALRNCGHLGRVGDWPQMAARAGKVSLHFVNTSGFGLLVAPFGGIDRRLSANPIAAGIPVDDGEPIILDISTCAIAEGKLKVARNKGVNVPPGSIIDFDGNATVDPNEFYADPPGAILPFGGHKGFCLGIVTELLAGAVAGNGCSQRGDDRLLNGMLAVVIDPQRLPTSTPVGTEVRTFVDFVKTSRRAEAGSKILMPGELEAQTRQHRLRDGIPLDGRTRAELTEVASTIGIPEKLIGALASN